MAERLTTPTHRLEAFSVGRGGYVGEDRSDDSGILTFGHGVV
jgi:hypothetical protein